MKPEAEIVGGGIDLDLLIAAQHHDFPDDAAGPPAGDSWPARSCGRADARRGWLILKKVARVYAQRGSDLRDGPHAHIDLAVFDHADDVLVLTGIDRERGLREAVSLAQPAHVPRQ